MQGCLLVLSAGPSQKVGLISAALALSVCPGCLKVAPGTVSVRGTVSTFLHWQKESPVTMTRSLDPVELVYSVTMDCAKVDFMRNQV